jgi:hypothetical protein
MARKALHHIHNWYAKNERPISRLSLVGGFVFNVFALTRVDEFIENFWIIVHLLIVAVCIILINREENEGIKTENHERLHFWLRNVLQFTFGGMLSTFIIFYLRSAVIAVAWPFFFVLAGAFIVNEAFKHHYSRISFQIGFFFLSVYLFLIFLVPVLMHEISTSVFLISGGMSMLVLLGFLVLVRRFTKRGFAKTRRELLGVIASIYITVNALYFLNLIPPLPLSLTDAGVYHSITRVENSQYAVKHEVETFMDRALRYISIYPTYHTTEGGIVYAYSAIFSPVMFKTELKHEWQKYDAEEKKWVTDATIALAVSGGRDEGYRTYSINNNLSAGKWRVNVETPGGLLVGRMAFKVEIVDEMPELVTEIKE